MTERAPDRDRSAEAATAAFSEHRDLLFSVAYSILGTVADTEDVLQETWLAWVGADRREVVNVRSYLVRIAVNEALSRLRVLQRRREAYVGPWLPEPLVAEDDAAEGVLRAESVSLALMVVLETLTPLERAVFVLREAFGYSHAEIAGMLGRSSSAVRQLAHRAREHVQARRPRTDVDPEQRREVTERFLAAAFGGDLNALMEILAPDVVMWTDGGGKTKAALRVIEGRDKVVRLLNGPTIRAELDGMSVRQVSLNGDPAALLFHGDEPYALGLVELTDDGRRVRGIYGILNPDKLRVVRASMD